MVCWATKVAKFACSFSAEKGTLRDNEGQFKGKITSLELVVIGWFLMLYCGLLWFIRKLLNGGGGGNPVLQAMLI